MPFFSDHITNMYYSGSPSYSSAPYGYSSSVLPFGSSYSASYLNPGGSYSTHSSLGVYSRPVLTSRYVTSSGRNYSPILSTISERGSSSPVRITSPRRVTISKRSYPSTSYTPRPININTADIDVSREKYRNKVASTSTPTPISATPQKESPKASPDQDGPFMPRVDGKPETGVDSSPGKQRSTIKRGRTVVRLHTLKRKERDSPRKPQVDDVQSTQQNATVGIENISDSSQVAPSEPVGWREKLSEDLVYIDKREKKTLGAKLVEKFIVKDKDDDIANPRKNQEDSNSLPVTPLPNNVSRSPDRRCSVEMLAEQANLLDSLIRGENLSTATLDLSKVGISDESKTKNDMQLIKRRKSYDPGNPLKTTKSDHSLHESMKSFRDNKDPKHFSKRRSLKKSSSGGSICRLDSITEFPRELILTDLPAIEESRLSIKRDSIKPKPKPKLKPKITSSVEITDPKIPLKFRIENVTVEEKTRAPKKGITYSTVVDDTPLQNETTINENITIKPRKSKVRYESKKRSKLLTSEEDEPILPEPEDCNFWDKIGKRETVYLMKRKQINEDSKEKHRRALYWFPVEEDSSINNENENNDFQYFDADSMQPQCSDTIENGPVVVDKSVESSEFLTLTNQNIDDQDNIKPSTENSEEILYTSTSSTVLPKESERLDEQKLSCKVDIDVPCQVFTDNNNENHTIIENREYETKAPECIKEINEIKHVNNTQSSVLENISGSVVLVTSTMPSVKNLPEDIFENNSLNRISDNSSMVPEQHVSDFKGSELTENKLTEKSTTEPIQDGTDPKRRTISTFSETLNGEQKADNSKISDMVQNKSIEEKYKPASKNYETNTNEYLLDNFTHLKTPQCIDDNKTLEKSKLQPNQSDINKSKKTNSTSVNGNKEQKSKTLNTNKTIKETEKQRSAKKDDIKEGKNELNKSSPKKKSGSEEVIDKLKSPETSKDNKVLAKHIPEQSCKANIENTPGSFGKGGMKEKRVCDPKVPHINEDRKLQVKCPIEQICKNSNVAQNTLQLTKKTDNSKGCNNESPPTSNEKPLTEISALSSSSNGSFKRDLSTNQSEHLENSNLNEKQNEGILNNSNEISNQEATSSDVSKLPVVKESENIPNNNNDVISEPAVQEQTTEEVKKAENISETKEHKEDIKQLSPKGFPKLLASPRKPVKEEPALRPLIATPRPLQKKVPQVIHSSSSSETSSDEEESSEEDDSDESDASRDSAEFFECENNPDGRTSTGSNDSGFDSSAPTSPAGFIQIKKDCDVNCHRKCEKLTANLCGVNQRLLVEALASRSASKKGGESPGTSSGNAPTQPGDATDILEQELEQSTAYSLFRKTGRFTPPARSIPRFRKYIIDDFQFIKVLGKGSFGKVLLAELRDTEYYYAVKCLKKDVVLEDDDVECTLIERKVLALGTNHPYLCHLFATFQSDSHLFFVMEYLNGGDLMFHIQQSGRFPELRARFYAAEIVSGLKFLHKRGIVYRDLKLDNILLDFDGHVRIADFGMCKLQIYLEKTADTFCGTPDYMAPEIIKGLKYNQTVDWWSFGVLLYEMLIGQSPFSGCDEDELFWSICNEMPSYPRFLSQEALAILTRLLDKDARTRLGGTECMHGDIREQDFFHAIHWERLERRELEAPFKPRVRHPLDTQYFDRAFTGERPRLTAVEPHVLRSMDQEPFRGFSYTNPNATDR